MTYEPTYIPADKAREIATTKRLRRSALPWNLPPRMLRREAAAEYVGVSPTTFDRGIEEGIYPKPVRVFGCVLWDVRKLDAACDALDTEDTAESVWARQRA